MQEAADDEGLDGIRGETEDQPSVQQVEVELGQPDCAEPQSGHRRHVRRDEGGDHRALPRAPADQILDAGVRLFHFPPPGGDGWLYYITFRRPGSSVRRSPGSST